jgi:hypothetical protein
MLRLGDFLRMGRCRETGEIAYTGPYPARSSPTANDNRCGNVEYG